jgi:molybdate transport system ATP-binding protein
LKLTFSHLRYTVPGFLLEVNAVLEGQIVALFGPSGAGKTSLLDLIAGLRTPGGGRIELDGEVLSDTEAGRRVPTRARGVGYVLQDQALFPHMSVRRNVLYGAREEARNRMFTLEHVAEVLEIGALLDRQPDTLSGGEKQRVALARALLSQPRVLLLDEPLSNLDEALRERSLELLRRLRNEFGTPMVYVSHRAEEIVGLCDDVMVLERGLVVGHGASEECFERTTMINVRVRTRRLRP